MHQHLLKRDCTVLRAVCTHLSGAGTVAFALSDRQSEFCSLKEALASLTHQLLPLRYFVLLLRYFVLPLRYFVLPLRYFVLPLRYFVLPLRYFVLLLLGNHRVLSFRIAQ